jgi:hypothetical protein
MYSNCIMFTFYRQKGIIMIKPSKAIKQRKKETYSPQGSHTRPVNRVWRWRLLVTEGEREVEVCKEKMCVGEKHVTYPSAAMIEGGSNTGSNGLVIVTQKLQIAEKKGQIGHLISRSKCN